MKNDPYFLIQIRKFSQPSLQNLPVKYGYDEYRSIRPELNFCSCCRALSDFPHFIMRYTFGIFLFENFAFPINSYMKPYAKCIYTTYTNSMQSSAHLIGVFVTFSSGMQHSHYNFQSTSFLLGHNACWNTAAIVFYGNRIILINCNDNIFAITCQRFIN